MFLKTQLFGEEFILTHKQIDSFYTTKSKFDGSETFPHFDTNKVSKIKTIIKVARIMTARNKASSYYRVLTLYDTDVVDMY